MTNPSLPTITVCVWTRQGTNLLYWDDAEDHGGFDRISPQGPYATDADLRMDIRSTFPRSNIEYVFQLPDYYFTGMADDRESDDLYGDDGHIPEPIRPNWNINALDLPDTYITVWTIVRNETDGPCGFQGVYLNVDAAKKAITGDLTVMGDIDELDGIYRVSDYEITENQVIGLDGAPAMGEIRLVAPGNPNGKKEG